MRPLRLDLIAFRSYDRVSVDWTPFDLVVIAGDTGAGKTSLLDAIAFALYGRTPENARPRDLLTLGHTHGEVRLTFRLRAECWRVTRRYGPDAPEPAHLLERLDPADQQTAVEAFTSDVDDRIRGLVGMSFGAFTSAVLLAQGRFAQFLGAAPKDRDAILRELFGVRPLESARAAALALKAAAEGRAEGIEVAAARLARHDARAWWEASRAARGASAALGGTRALRHLAGRIDALTAEQRTVLERITAVREAASLLPDPGRVAELTRRLADAEREVDAARSDHAHLVAVRDAARNDRERLRNRLGGDAADVAALRETAERVLALEAGMVQRRKEVDEERAALDAAAARQETLAAQGRERVARVTAVEGRRAALAEFVAAERAALDADRAHAEARQALERSAARHDEASRAHREAQQALDAAHRADMAAALRSGLGPGDPCPVCGGPVHADSHESGAHADLTACRRALDTARGAERAAGATRAADAARTERAEADQAAAHRRRTAAAAAAEGIAGTDDPAAALEALDAELYAERAALEDDRRRYAESGTAIAERQGALRRTLETLALDEAACAQGRARLGTWADRTDPVAALQAALAQSRSAERLVEDADTAAARAAANLDQAAGRLAREREETIGRLRAAIARAAAAAGRPPLDVADPAQMPAACDELRAALQAVAAEDQARAADIQRERHTAQTRLVAAGTPLGISDAARVEAAVRSREEAVRSARAGLEAVRVAAAQAAELRRRAAEDRAEGALHAQVALDLQANRFPRFLLGRFRERLAAGASTRLQELSNGAYRFLGTGQDPLAVVDLRRGERTRSAATLSGGERFLASLALALGLSDIAAESGGRLDCLFLDEGFSTLDAESLEQALAGVERLGGDGRLVAVITHLPGVSERLGAVLRVAKDATGVSRVVDEAFTRDEPTGGFGTSVPPMPAERP